MGGVKASNEKGFKKVITSCADVDGYNGLPGSSVGNTVGEGIEAQITLDTNAAGHNWYIDGEALTPTLSQCETEQDPSNPFAPSPLSALGLLPFGLMRGDGQRLVHSGVTSREELVRVARD